MRMRDMHWTTRAPGVTAALGAFTVIAVGVASGAVGCAGERNGVTAAEPRKVKEAAPSVARAHVPAGTDFTVTLNERIASTSAMPGTTFTATVQKPLVGSDGLVLVQQGATLRGRVVAVDGGQAPSMKLAFDSVETVDGTAPVSARIAAADEYGFTVGAFDYDPDVVGYDSVLYPGTIGPGMGGGPIEPPAPEATEIVIPTGGELKLVLTRPLWEPPSAR